MIQRCLSEIATKAVLFLWDLAAGIERVSQSRLQKQRMDPWNQ